MVMSGVHLPRQIQLPVSPSLALEDDGDQGSLGVSVLSGCQCVQPRRHQSTEQNCSLPQELGNYLQSKYQTKIKYK